jgi:hypothetical protein
MASSAMLRRSDVSEELSASSQRTSVVTYGYAPRSPVLVTLMMRALKILRNTGSYKIHIA